MNRRNFGTVVIAGLAIGAWAMTGGTGQRGTTAVMQAGGVGCNAAPFFTLDEEQNESVADKLALDGGALVSSTDKRGNPPPKPPKCRAPLTTCTGSCVDTKTDYFNCGACGVQCSNNQVCSGGVCGCPSGQTSCNGTCVSTTSDNANCGVCGNACTTGLVCQNGSCAACGEGTADCGGACIDVLSDGLNCGACGNACATGLACQNGSCSLPWCGDILFDGLNCGACGHACQSLEYCSWGECYGVCLGCE